MNPLHEHKVMSVGYQVKQNLKSHENLFRKVSWKSGPKIGPATGVRGLIVLSIVSRGGEVCIAYTSVLVNLWHPKHILGYLYQFCSVD